MGRPGVRAAAAALLVVSSAWAAGAQPAPGPSVRLWGGASPPPGEVVSVTLDGVLVRQEVPSAPGAPAGEIETLLGLDRVQRVFGEHADAFVELEPIARDAWRARARLERGDPVAAEPLYESLAEIYRGRTGPTASAVFEGLLRCRLRRGAYPQAIDAWLGWTAAAGANDAGLIGSLRGVVDRGTGLVPSLPPFWIDTPNAVRFARDAAADPGEGRGAVIAALYRAAAAADTGEAWPGLPEAPAADAGLGLVRDAVAARAPDAETREAARARLGQRLGPETPGWIEAWVRAGLGLSLLREGDERSTRLGIVQLLHVHVRLGDENPYLGGLALARAAEALSAAGEAAGAAALIEDLVARYPGHPVLAETRTGELVRRLLGRGRGSGAGASDGSGAAPREGSL